jgi:peroxiredoxin Q/BCP
MIARTLQLLIVMLSLTTSIKAQSPVDFTLASVTDTSHFTLSKAKGKYVALHFLLKTECPYCIRHTHEYFEKSSSLQDVQQVFIKPDTEQEIKEWAIKLSANDPLKYPIYRDANAALATQYNVPNGYTFHGQVVHYPALILLDKSGKEVFRYVGKNNSDRFSFANLTAKIEELDKANK